MTKKPCTASTVSGNEYVKSCTLLTMILVIHQFLWLTVKAGVSIQNLYGKRDAIHIGPERKMMNRVERGRE